MTSLGWFLMAVGLAVWAVGAHEFVTSELVEFLRGGPPEGGPPILFGTEFAAQVV